MPTDPARTNALIDAFAKQARWCARLGSPFTAGLLLWPGARDEQLAQAHPHGEWVQWQRR